MGSRVVAGSLAHRSLVALACAGPAACSSHSSVSPSATASASAEPTTVSATTAPPESSSSDEQGPPWLGIHKSADDVLKVINRENHPVYTGKTGTVRGTITIAGDPPPDVPFDAEHACLTAKGYYDRLFRKGDKGVLADALVAVTKYEGFVPAKTRAKTVLINDCSFGTRTLAVTFGQRIDVLNRETHVTFMPFLDGASFHAALVATPQGNPVKLYPDEPKPHYLLRDMLKHSYMIADVFVVPYATVDVSGADGHYEIQGVPVGKARIDALLPVIDKSTGKDIDVHEGENVVDIELTYDKGKDKAVPIPEAVWRQN